MYALDTASWKPLEQHSVCRHLSCQHVWWASANFFCLFHHVPPIYHYWGWTFFQLNGREQNFYCWGVHQCSCSLLSLHHNVLVLTNLTTGQTIILRHRQNLWMGKSFRDTQSTFHLWELLVHVLLGSQMDAGGTAFKSRGSGKNTSFSITARLMPVFFGSEVNFVALLRQMGLFLTLWFPWETPCHHLPQLWQCHSWGGWRYRGQQQQLLLLSIPLHFGSGIGKTHHEEFCPLYWAVSQPSQHSREGCL